jgi:hypothetical protein
LVEQSSFDLYQRKKEQGKHIEKGQITRIHWTKPLNSHETLCFRDPQEQTIMQNHNNQIHSSNGFLKKHCVNVII